MYFLPVFVAILSSVPKWSDTVIKLAFKRKKEVRGFYLSLT